MKNKIDLKKCLVIWFAAMFVFLGMFLVLHQYEYHQYVKNYNTRIGAIVEKVTEKYPNVKEQDLVEILLAKEMTESSLIEKYGIDIENETIILENKISFGKMQVCYVIWLWLFGLSLIAIFLRYNHRKDMELEQITKYIAQINKRSYHMQIDDISEDELSILKNEIYKTTVMLKETAELSKKGKADLKNSLSDISHQLKTPLTSILVMLDNMIDDPQMPDEIRGEFLKEMKREIVNINFLVQSLLKLSKFDADTITFFRETVSAGSIIREAVKNTETLCDLKSITIEVSTHGDDVLECDVRWQAEAVTNVLKNCVEHSPEGASILINTERNNVYTAITIQDFGEGIDEEDRRHIFERFYKGKNASKDSVGIGLALAKTIIEADNGRITVESGADGTTFFVKYFHV